MNQMVTSNCAFELENDLSLISPLIKYLRQRMRDVGISDDSERLRISVALEEAILNAYYHGNLEVDSTLREEDNNQYLELAKQRSQEAPYRDRCIGVEARLSSSEVTFVVRDGGRGFDPSTLPNPTDSENLSRPHGRGILLMRTFMDEVIFNERGNEITLRRVFPVT